MIANVSREAVSVVPVHVRDLAVSALAPSTAAESCSLDACEVISDWLEENGESDGASSLRPKPTGKSDGEWSSRRRRVLEGLLGEDGRSILDGLVRDHYAALALHRKVSTAHVAWEQSDGLAPRDPQRTLFVIDRFTTFESYPAVAIPQDEDERLHPERIESRARRYGDWTYWWNVTRQHLPLHPTAHWLRVVNAEGGYRPKSHETLLVRRKRRGEDYYVDVRCGVETCACRGTLFGLVSA